jgi:hypothetical protein
MGNASVHVPTSIENAISAHRVAQKGQDTADLAGLFVEQMLQEVAREGGSTTDLPPVSHNATDVESLLDLARFSPLPRFFGYKKHYLAAMLKFRIYSFASIIRPGSGNLWSKLSNYHELQNLRGLLRILRTYLPLDETTKSVQQIMVELRISPIPSMNHLRPVLRNLRRDHKLTGTLSMYYSAHFSLMEERQDLPKVLARLLYAASVRRFFVYCGPLADWLRGSADSVHLDIEMLRGDMDLSDWTSRRGANSRAQWPAFVIPKDRRGDYGGQTEAQFSRYGDVVEHAELRNLVLRLANRQKS